MIQKRYNHEQEAIHMAYSIRDAREEDFPRIQEIYRYARAFMENTGNPNQWGKTHPPAEQLLDDIRNRNLYVIEDKEGIHGVFAFLLGEDPTYARIEGGNWHAQKPYGTIHRIAGDGSGGILKSCVAYCAKITDYLRIDTHNDNRVMQRAIGKEGFEYCGIIYIADGSPRLAYDKEICCISE